MLKSLRNRQLSQPTRRNGRLLVADAEKRIKSFKMIKQIAIEFVQERQIGQKVNTILEM